jgi:predicted permease
MIQTIVSALLPAFIILALGYFAARHHDFGLPGAQILNRMVLDYALPLSIFVSIVRTTRAELGQDVPLLIVLVVAIVGIYAVVFLLSRSVFRLSLGMSALGALAASAPNAPFVGPAVLGYLYGPASGIPIALVGVIAYITVAPATIICLSLATQGSASTPAQPAASPAASSSSTPAPRVSVASTVVGTLKQPLVWLPVLGFIIVLIGISPPPLITNALELLGQSAGGVALFSAGIILASFNLVVDRFVLSVTAIKNIVQPGLVFAALTVLGYTNPLLGEATVTTSLPVFVLVAMLALQYQIAEKEATSALLISTVGSLITTGAFIALTGG